MYCTNCGKRKEANEKFCSGCGKSFCQEQGQIVNDTGSFGWAVLGFLSPIVGIVLYLCWKNNKPKSGKKALHGAAVSIIISLILNFLLAIFSFFLSIDL